MKKIMVALVCLMCFVGNIIAGEAIDIKKNPPKAGSPESVVVSFLDLCVSNKLKDALAILDSDEKEKYGERDSEKLKKLAKRFSSWDFSKKYTYFKLDKEDYIKIRIHSVLKDNEDQKVGETFELKKVDKKWKISKIFHI